MFSNFTILLLAAGESRRLGRPKQLESQEGETFLKRTVKLGLSLNPQELVVVLGAYAEECLKETQSLPVRALVHERWQEGMGSSLAFGVQSIQVLGAPPLSQGVLILLVDQWKLTTENLTPLMAAIAENPEKRVASSYDETVGVPAYFPRSWWGCLSQLQGDQGAKGLLRQELESLIVVSLQEAAQDWDLP